MNLKRLLWTAAVLVGASLAALVPSTAEAVSLEGLKMPEAPVDAQAGLDLLPEGLRDYYSGFWLFSTIGPNPYASWQPKPGPWKFCYNDSYQGNAWRQAALDKYKALVVQAQADGIASGELVVTNSNNDANLQLAQLNNLVREGCHVILSIPSSPTGLCSGVKEAFENGVLFIAVESPVQCPEAISVGFNEYFVSVKLAKWIADSIGGKGNVAIVNGIPGLAPTAARRQAAYDVFGQFPDIKVVGEIEGEWTPSVIKTNTLKFLATHPQQIDAVFDAGAGAVAVGEAFEQSGRAIPKVNGFSGECFYLAYAKEKDLDVYSASQSGGGAVATGFDTAVRMLKGEKPVVNNIMVPLPEITNENFAEWYKPTMTTQDSCYAESPDGSRVPADLFDQFFNKS